jgi:hypothetical protein
MGQEGSINLTTSRSYDIVTDVYGFIRLYTALCGVIRLTTSRSYDIVTDLWRMRFSRNINGLKTQDRAQTISDTDLHHRRHLAPLLYSND